MLPMYCSSLVGRFFAPPGRKNAPRNTESTMLPQAIIACAYFARCNLQSFGGLAQMLGCERVGAREAADIARLAWYEAKKYEVGEIEQRCGCRQAREVACADGRMLGARGGYWHG